MRYRGIVQMMADMFRPVTGSGCPSVPKPRGLQTQGIRFRQVVISLIELFPQYRARNTKLILFNRAERNLISM
jgi:hypothetical protein